MPYSLTEFEAWFKTYSISEESKTKLLDLIRVWTASGTWNKVVEKTLSKTANHDELTLIIQRFLKDKKIQTQLNLFKTKLTKWTKLIKHD